MTDVPAAGRANDPRRRHRRDKLSLIATAREQTRKAVAASGGRAAHTVYGGHDRSLRQTVIALPAGSVLAEHENPGEATVHVLTGRVRLDGTRASWEGSPGGLLGVPQERHSLSALEDSSVLLTVVKHGWETAEPRARSRRLREGARQRGRR